MGAFSTDIPSPVVTQGSAWLQRLLEVVAGAKGAPDRVHTLKVSLATSGAPRAERAGRRQALVNILLVLMRSSVRCPGTRIGASLGREGGNQIEATGTAANEGRSGSCGGSRKYYSHLKKLLLWFGQSGDIDFR